MKNNSAKEKMSKGVIEVNVGDVVLFDEHDLGVVRFVGVAKHSSSKELVEGEPYVGIELKGGSEARTRYAASLMDGSVDGVEYFTMGRQPSKGLGNGLLIEASRVRRKVSAEELLNKVASLWSVIRYSRDTSEVSKQMVHRDVYNEVVIENERLRMQLTDGQVLIQSLQMQNEILRGDSAKKLKDNAELSSKVSKWADRLGLSHMRRPTLSALTQDSIDQIHDILRRSEDHMASEEASSGRYSLSSPQGTPDGYVPPVISRRGPDSGMSKSKRGTRSSRVLDLDSETKRELSDERKAREVSSEGDSEEDEHFDAVGYSKGSLRRKKPAAKHRSRESTEITQRDVDQVMVDPSTQHTKSKLSMDLESAPDWIAGDLDSSKTTTDITGDDDEGLISDDTSAAKGSFAPPSAGGSTIAGVSEDAEDYSWGPDHDTEPVSDSGHRKRGSMDMDVPGSEVSAGDGSAHGRDASISSVLSENNYFNQID